MYAEEIRKYGIRNLVYLARHLSRPKPQVPFIFFRYELPQCSADWLVFNIPPLTAAYAPNLRKRSKNIVSTSQCILCHAPSDLRILPILPASRGSRKRFILITDYAAKMAEAVATRKDDAMTVVEFLSTTVLASEYRPFMKSFFLSVLVTSEVG